MGALVSNGSVHSGASPMLRRSLRELVYQSAIAERIPFGILKDAHRQIYAKNAGGAAGSAGACVETEQFRNHQRTFSFRSSGPKPWHNAPAVGDDWRKYRSVAVQASRRLGHSSQ